MPAALQMPLEVGEARQLGGRLFRKQVLRHGEIDYKGRKLSFDRPLMEQLVASFDAGAFDQVPLVLANEDNQHNEDPDRFRGEVKAFELTDDGLDAIVELTDEGAELVRRNPRLGVSARIVEALERADGKQFGRAIRHVCATLDPKLNGMRPWESVSLSVRWGPQDGDQVIDLSRSTYMPQTQTPTFSDEQLEELKGLSGDARTAKVQELLGESSSADTGEEKKSRFPNLRKLFGLKEDTPDDELDSALAKFVSDEPGDKDRTGDADKDRAALASLTAEQRKAIDLANSDAAAAKADARKARAEVAESKWKLERKELADEGVPPALLDLCEPYLKDGQSQVIDLSNGDKFDVADTLHKVLAECKGYVDLSQAGGSPADSDEAKEAKELANDDNWESSI